MKRVIHRAALSAATVGLSAAALALPTAANAAKVGDLCTVAAPGASVYMPQYQLSYWIAAGGGFRIEGFDGPNSYLGHGNGQPSGSLPRSAVIQSTCH